MFSLEENITVFSGKCYRMIVVHHVNRQNRQLDIAYDESEDAEHLWSDFEQNNSVAIGPNKIARCRRKSSVEVALNVE